MVNVKVLLHTSITLTWKHLTYDVSKVADNAKHFCFPQILIGYVWCVIAVK